MTMSTQASAATQQQHDDERKEQASSSSTDSSESSSSECSPAHAAAAAAAAPAAAAAAVTPTLSTHAIARVLGFDTGRRPSEDMYYVRWEGCDWRQDSWVARRELAGGDVCAQTKRVFLAFYRRVAEDARRTAEIASSKRASSSKVKESSIKRRKQ